MAHEKQLKNPKYRTWVKAGLGLKYVKEGLEQFTVDILDEQHQAILMTVRKSSKSMSSHCNQCQINTLMPNHVRTKSNHCPFGVSDCNCRQSRGKLTCPNDICGGINEQIILLHASFPPAPYWRNTESTLWCSSPWEIAKCFINAPGYAHTTSASGTDCAGLLHIIVNHLGFHSHLKCDITGSDIFSKTRQYRNEILHSASMELEDNTADGYIDDMIAVLKDPKELCLRPESVNAVRKLTELKNKDFVITTENEMEIIQEMRSTLTKETDESVQKLKAYATEAMTEIEKKKQNIDNDITQSKSDVIDQIQTIRDDILNKHTSELSVKTSELKGTIEETAKEHENRIVKYITTATNDFNISKIEAIKEMQTAQSDMFNKHLIQLDKKVEEINIQLSAKEKEISKTFLGTLAEQKQTTQSCPKFVIHDDQCFSFTARHEGECENKKESTCLEDVEACLQKHADYDISKQEFKKRLIDLYMETLVKESALPLHPEMNDATINELYVTPWMKFENNYTLKTKSADNVTTRKEHERKVQDFYDIFYQDCKQLKLIYIIGDAGSGKSAFCKNMIYKWCLSHSEEKQTNIVVNQRKHMVHGEMLSDDDIMKSYGFLFYISLRHNTDTGDIKTMLNNHYEDQLLDTVLERESENCLILIDGLDEWKPPKENKMSQTQTIGLPIRDIKKHYTIITTSRPWKIEVLKIKESEMDTRIRLCGIEYKSVIKMATYIVSQLNTHFEKKKSVNRFLAKYVLSNDQNKTPFCDIIRSPVMLKQLVCLWFEDRLCHSSRCQIYCNMLELSLEWSVQRKPEDKIFETFRERSLDSEDISLPLTFDEDSICEEYKLIISTAGKIAYHTLFSEQKETSLTFSQAVLRKYGASKDFIQCCLEMGILTEEQNIAFSLTKRRSSQFSFTHKSIQEVLAAIFIVMECQTREHDIGRNETMHTISECFKNVKSVEEILEQYYVIELICGLNPALGTHLSRYIYDIVVRDERFMEYRSTIANFYENNIVFQIQELIFGCIKELQSSKGVKDECMYLADVLIQNKSDIPLLKYIKAHNIMTITIAGEIWGLSRSSIHLSDNDVEILCNIVRKSSPSLRRFTKIDPITADAEEELPIYYELVSSACTQLQVLEIRCIRLSHSYMCRLSALIENNINLQELSLTEIRCDDDSCGIHDIKLCDNTILRNIDIDSNDFRLQDLNVDSLINCCLKGMNNFNNIGRLLSRALCLEYLNLSSCTFILVNQILMTDMKNLRTVEFSDIQVNETTLKLFVCSLKTCPSIRSLKLSSMRLAEKVKTSLLTDLQEVYQIESLYLKSMNVSLRFPTNLTHLKLLALDNISCFLTSMNDLVEGLHNLCKLEHISLKNMDFQTTYLHLSSNLMCLKHVSLQNIKLAKKAWMEFGESLNELRNLEILHFQSLNIPDNCLKFTRNIHHLKIISFEKVMLSLDSWKEIADTLSALSQSVEVRTEDLYIENGSLESAIEYIKKRNDLFQVTVSFGVDCNYRTIKSSL